MASRFEDPEDIRYVSDRSAEKNGDGIADRAVESSSLFRNGLVNRGEKGDRENHPNDLMRGKSADTANPILDEL